MIWKEDEEMVRAMRTGVVAGVQEAGGSERLTRTHLSSLAQSGVDEGRRLHGPHWAKNTFVCWE